MNYIKFLDENEEVDRKSVGGKGFALFELLKLGLNVPKGFVITTNAFKIYKNSMIPQSVESEIYEAYDILNCERVAVRSSATLEDSKNSSFAGVFETVLNVTREDLIESVKKVYASLDNAAGYNKSGLMAVIIQEMIDSDFAGVVFTKNPLTKENEFVVEVVSGLGEALVSGVVNSTQYIVKNNSVRLVRNPLQEFKLVVKSRGVEVKKIKNKVKLSKNIILKLVRKSMIIEKNFQTPQDIEWCEKKGVLYFLQSRPLIFQQKNFEKNSIKKFEFKGIGVSAGVVTEKAVIIRNEKDFKKILKGSIAVVTLPSDFHLINILKKASGMITEYGSVLSHPAVLAREFNIPCIVGVKNLSKK